MEKMSEENVFGFSSRVRGVADELCRRTVEKRFVLWELVLEKLLKVYESTCVGVADYKCVRDTFFWFAGEISRLGVIGFDHVHPDYHDRNLNKNAIDLVHEVRSLMKQTPPVSWCDLLDDTRKRHFETVRLLMGLLVYIAQEIVVQTMEDLKFQLSNKDWKHITPMTREVGREIYELMTIVGENVGVVECAVLKADWCGREHVVGHTPPNCLQLISIGPVLYKVSLDVAEYQSKVSACARARKLALAKAPELTEKVFRDILKAIKHREEWSWGRICKYPSLQMLRRYLNFIPNIDDEVVAAAISTWHSWNNDDPALPKYKHLTGF